ncbi:ABC transporter ATP-binding protein [Lachnospira eligens]|mgnify:FL=1|jgi:ATP-binding cassette subfamily B protein|uniref:ABC transporter ATP-binding protein n=1 Tax=Lachnospira eligens TaxID=39485 RepID=A0A414D7J8_9FIRM|nr:ABC transporter ATP-binding protein [Lachnospira eligens]RHD06834.1 ABC transporter ATP-binding protein [Lachnospira eligens]
MNLHAPKGIDVENWFIECYRKYKGHPLKILIGLYKGNYNKFFLAVLFFFIKHAPVWVLPIVTANIINDITSGSPETVQNIIIQAIIMVALVVLNVPMNYLYTRYKSLATRYAETGLRKALVRKLQQLSISYHKETQSGRLQSKIMRDVEAVETLSTQMFLSILNIALNIGVALFVTISKSLIVFLFFLLTTPLAAATMVFFRNIMKKRNTEFRKEMEETSARVMEMVELIPVTRAHALEEEEVTKMSGQLFTVAEKGYKLDVIQALFGSVGWAIFQVFQVVCLGFTGFLALKGSVGPGDITLYQSYFATIVSQVSSLMSLIPVIAKGVESVNSIGEVLLEEDIECNDGKEALKSVEGEFDFKNVRFAYNNTDKPVLHELNLHVDKGQTIALVGESGAGKSTILNLVIGFNFATDGVVTIDGHDMRDIDLRSYRKHLAVVPQTSILFSGTIRDNITYGIDDFDEESLNKVVDAANLRDLIDSLPDGLDTVVGEHGGKLSGGQRQRVSIARALMRNPEVIVLDEATSALDSISEKLIQEALNNLTKDRTTFIVAHRLSTIKGADRIAVIADGHCVEYGTYDELMELKGEFYQMKSIQS